MGPLSEYFYNIEDKNIRKNPLKKRDDARIFVYDTKKDQIIFDFFKNIYKYLPKKSLLVLNDTGVIPARVTFLKENGGKCNGLVLINEGVAKDGMVPVIVDRKINVGQKLYIDKYLFIVKKQEEEKFFLKPDFDMSKLSYILNKYGKTPTPPYLGKQELSENDLRDRYQTIFAKNKKSVAAPTASLHFTESVFHSLSLMGINKTYITLDVGLGTFANVKEENLKNKNLHSEIFGIKKEVIHSIFNQKQNKNSIIAVGTTVVRTLESQSDNILSNIDCDIKNKTDIFIMPHYQFKIVDHLITNFHVPKSSLMALVDAFLEHKKSKRRIVELYEIAKKEGFMFFSFGDSMLIL